MKQSMAKPTTLSNAERLGYWINDNVMNLRVLMGSIACVMLATISITFNYELGKMLASDETSAKLLPIGYALLDVAGLFISGYLTLNGKRVLSKLIGGAWFVFLLCLSLFAAWTYQCALDHKKLSKPVQEQRAQLIDAIERERKNVAYWDAKKLETIKYKTKYNNHANQAIEKRNQYQNELKTIDDKSYPPEMAVFYKTPVLKNNPEESITIMRFVLAAAMTLTPLLLLGLMGAERGDISTKKTNPNPEAKTSPQKRHRPRKTKAKTSYTDVKKSVISGDIRPSKRGITDRYRLANETALQYLKQMQNDGIIYKHGQGYRLKDASNNIIQFSSNQ